MLQRHQSHFISTVENRLCGMGEGKGLKHTTLLTCNGHAVLRGKKKNNKTVYYPLNKTHLEKVILVHNTAVGQRLDQLIC